MKLRTSFTHPVSHETSYTTGCIRFLTKPATKQLAQPIRNLLPMNLLFLCTGNYYRSRFAEYYVRHRANELGLDWSIDSRGLGLTSSNVGPLSQYTIAECNRLGILFQPCRLPLALSTSDLELADRTIALKESEHRPLMQRLFPEWESRITYWHVHDIDCATPEEALPQLRQLLDELVQQLSIECSLGIKQ